MMEPLIYKYFNGSITPEEKSLLFSSMEKDSELRKEFRTIKEIDTASSSIPHDGDAEMALESLLQFNSRKDTSSHRKITFRKISWYSAAAVIVIALGIFGFMRINDVSDTLDTEKALAVSTTTPDESTSTIEVQTGLAFEVVSTGAGEVRSITLADGSTVWMNASTTLRYPKTFNKNERHVELVEGEAFFDVTHNKDLPFVVTSKGYDIRVLGTKFNVLAYPETSFKTSLVEGSIEVFPSEKKSEVLRISPNQSAQDINGKLVYNPQINTDELLWKDGILVFKNTSFSEIAAKFESYYGIEISLDDEDISTHKFSGKFRRSDGPKVALEAMQKAYGFNYECNGNSYKITR